MSDEEPPNAYEELLHYLQQDGERIEWVVIGDPIQDLTVTSPVEADKLVPEHKRHILLDPGDAEYLMMGWHLVRAQPISFAIHVWTDQRILRSYLIAPPSWVMALMAFPREPTSYRVYTVLPWIFKGPSSK